MNRGLPFRFAVILLLATGVVFVTSVKGENNFNKTKAEVDALITTVGSTMPDWWESVELDYPDTLDLNWPVRQSFGFRSGGFEGRMGGGRGRRGRRMRGGFFGTSDRGFGAGQNSSMNVDDYLVQVVYPNPSRHKTGIKLVNHLMILHKDDKQKLARSLNTLGDMFYQLLGDYARAAFWWQKSAQMGGSMDSLKMAHCYFELGSKATAKELLSQTESSFAPSNKNLIKLWARIGEVDKALNMIESSSSSSYATGRLGRQGRSGLSQSDKYLFSAEICRGAGRYDEAIAFYEKLLALPDSQTRPMSRHETDDKFEAGVNLAAVKLIKELDLKRITDGSYNATVQAYGGPLTMKVDFKNGHIESVDIVRHSETYSYLISALPTAQEIVSKQGFEGVHAITGATVTSDGIINATAKALSGAMR